jgi:hypothetical protein
MEITELKIGIGRTVPNPLREFSNLRVDVELTVRTTRPWESDPTAASRPSEALHAIAMKELEDLERALIAREAIALDERMAGDAFVYRCRCGHVEPLHRRPGDACFMLGCTCEGFEDARRAQTPEDKADNEPDAEGDDEPEPGF